MTELKTLKDLDLKEHDFIGENALMSNFHGLAIIKELKQEAIKWVKSVGKDDWSDGWQAFFDFFNLTEEDLK